MNDNIFKRIEQWNIDRDNTNFSHFNETKMLVEELFEFCGYERKDAKALSYKFAEEHSLGRLYSTDDLADAAGDMIYIAVGTIVKLGLDPYTVMKTICDHNDAKGKLKDKYGKIIKDDKFIEPIHTK